MRNSTYTFLPLLIFIMLLFSCEGNAQKKSAINSSTKFNINKSDAEWEKELTPMQFQVLRQKATEPAWSGKFNNHHEKGTYVCAACNEPVFSSSTKFESGSGWPSFTAPFSKKAVHIEIDKSHGMTREEILCANCGGHLGHKFPDGPRDKGGQRYCINSVSLDFKKP
ncbi:MAG TPA: peptide-methionine (R)-S-oxide reductase MsrB [Anditalea sp.]|nr:peptide-methionine (R)-S-oxide reductase MsrB [Anditalea sp.]